MRHHIRSYLLHTGDQCQNECLRSSTREYYDNFLVSEIITKFSTSISAMESIFYIKIHNMTPKILHLNFLFNRKIIFILQKDTSQLDQHASTKREHHHGQFFSHKRYSVLLQCSIEKGLRYWYWVEYDLYQRVGYKLYEKYNSSLAKVMYAHSSELTFLRDPSPNKLNIQHYTWILYNVI